MQGVLLQEQLREWHCLGNAPEGGGTLPVQFRAVLGRFAAVVVLNTLVCTDCF